MKRLSVLFLAAVAMGAIAVNAEAGRQPSSNLKTYDCTASIAGGATVDKITLRANGENLVMNFPDYAVDDHYTASFERSELSNVPDVLKGHSGGEYFAASNRESLIKGDDAELKPMYAFVTNGILRSNESGKLIVLYKRTFKNQPGSNAHEWSRTYECDAR